MNKKFILPVLAASAVAAFAPTAMAQDAMNYDIKHTYFAIDAQSVDFDGTGGNEYGALNFAAGVRANRNLGFEAAYFITEENDFGVNEFWAHGVTADVIGYLPVTNDDRFEVLGNVGIALTRFETNGGDNTDIGLRLGVGAQYHINDKWAARARINYTETDEGGIDDYTTVSIGGAYKF